MNAVAQLEDATHLEVARAAQTHFAIAPISIATNLHSKEKGVAAHNFPIAVRRCDKGGAAERRSPIATPSHFAVLQENVAVQLRSGLAMTTGMILGLPNQPLGNELAIEQSQIAATRDKATCTHLEIVTNGKDKELHKSKKVVHDGSLATVLADDDTKSYSKSDAEDENLIDSSPVNKVITFGSSHELELRTIIGSTRVMFD
ncbi:hypothetical protein ACH5RR_032672 [Cinchona calisaya]|uniref:Uncharacterized protein n=1 Tax=Cinchona calisaya TaxID=153742 RepID=A0ABD2YIR9_9GENT